MYGGKPQGIDPEIDGGYLLDALFAVGPTEWRQGEEIPVSWSELRAYGQATGVLSEPWEYEAVSAMSRAYFRAKQEGKDVHCIPPVERET